MKIRTEIRNTENPEKIKKHVEELIPTAKLTVDKDKKEIRGQGEFKDIWEKSKKLKITKTVLNELEKNRAGEETYIELDKVSASVGKPSIYVKSATSKINLTIPWRKIEEISEETLKDK